LLNVSRPFGSRPMTQSPDPLPVQPGLPRKNAPKLPNIEGIRRLSNLLDEAIAIPGTSWRFGLDPLLSLIPAAGDYISLSLSVYIVWQAYRLGTPRETLIQMVIHLFLDAFLGTVPVAGDAFDFVWKANTKNLQLLESHLAHGGQRDTGNLGTEGKTRPGDRWFLLLLISGVAVFVIGATALFLFLLRSLLSAVFPAG